MTFKDKEKNEARSDPLYVAMGHEAASRMIAITVLVFIGAWVYLDNVIAALVVALLVLLLLSGYIQLFTSDVLSPLAQNVSLWAATRKTERMGETAVTDQSHPLWIGYHGQGEAVITSLDKMTSTAVWGVNGAGKTTLLHTILYELMAAYRDEPDELHVVIFDHGKDGNDFSPFARIPFLHGIPIATNDNEAIRLLDWLKAEMTRRGELFRKIPDRYLCNELARYHDLRVELRLEDELPRLPYLVVIVDEVQDLTEKQIGGLPLLIALAKKGRFVGIKLIIATQYPNVNSIPADLRSQLWTRFCGTLASPREFAIVAEIHKEFTEGVTLSRGQFFARLAGYPDWIVMRAIKIPTSELERDAEAISAGIEIPRWDNLAMPAAPVGKTAVALRQIDEGPDKIVWRELGGQAAKETAFMQFLQQYEVRPSASDVLTYFQMTEKTAYSCLERYWPKRQRELSR